MGSKTARERKRVRKRYRKSGYSKSETRRSMRKLRAYRNVENHSKTTRKTRAGKGRKKTIRW